MVEDRCQEPEKADQKVRGKYWVKDGHHALNSYLHPDAISVHVWEAYGDVAKGTK